MGANLNEVISQRTAVLYVLCLGLVFGGFIGYLSSAQQLLQESYELGEAFPLHFALLAFTMGGASLLNSRLVTRWGLQGLVLFSLGAHSLASAIFLILFTWQTESPAYSAVVVYLATVLFFTGLLFANLNALAMTPFGHIAGIAASFVGTVSTLIAVVIGIFIGRLFDGTILPLVSGMLICAGGAFVLSLIPMVISRSALKSELG